MTTKMNANKKNNNNISMLLFIQCYFAILFINFYIHIYHKVFLKRDFHVFNRPPDLAPHRLGFKCLLVH